MPSAPPKNLDKFFNPSSIAIIGASRDKNKIGNIAVRNIKNSGYKGKIYPVNLKAGSICGLKAYKSIQEIPESVDLVIISLPANFVDKVLDEVIESDVKNILIYSAGFKEVGEKGKKLEERLKGKAKKYDLNILGPNCMGFLNTDFNLNTTFGSLAELKGNLQFISQSGAIASSLFDFSKEVGLGFGNFITLGNKAVLDEADVLNYLHEKFENESYEKKGYSQNYPIGLYLESLSRGREFLEVVSKITKKHPVFILKPGRTKASQKAMQSHTGSLAGNSVVTEAAFKQFGVISCGGVEDLFDLSKVFSWENPPSGPNVALISNAGGPAVISSDVVSESNLEFAQISKKTKNFLKKYLPKEASIVNPIDVLGDALVDRYKASIQAVLANKEVHSLIVILTPQLLTQVEETAKVIGELAANYKKPVVCSFIGGYKVEEGERVLDEYKIPSFRYPERAIKALSKLWEWEEFREKTLLTSPTGLSRLDYKPRNDESLKRNDNNGEDSWNIYEKFEKQGIKIPPEIFTNQLSEVEKFAAEHDFPVVLKLHSKKVLHKAEYKGVITDISTKEDLKSAYKHITKVIKENDLKDAKVRVQKQIEDGVEIIVGFKRDKSFGPFVFFGIGGTYVELFKDSNIKILPVKHSNIEDMVKNSKAHTLLSGYRGSEKKNLESLYNVIEILGNVFINNPSIKELEVNPVIVTSQYAWAVDIKIV